MSVYPSLEREHILKLLLALQRLTQDACRGPYVCSSTGRIRPYWSEPSWVHYSRVMQECLKAPMLCHQVTLPGCAGGWGGRLLHPPSVGSCKTPAVHGHRTPAATTSMPGPPLSSGPALLEELLFGLLPCLGVFEPMDDSDLRSGTCLHSQGGRRRSMHKHSWQRGSHTMPSVPPMCGWPCHALSCSCQGW